MYVVAYFMFVELMAERASPEASEPAINDDDDMGSEFDLRGRTTNRLRLLSVK